MALLYLLLSNKIKIINIIKKFTIIALSMLQKKDNTLNNPIRINDKLIFFWLFKFSKKNIKQSIIGRSLYEKTSAEPTS